MSHELTTFSLSQPQQALEVATILQKFVKEKNLTANIQGKQYPLVEAWQFAGSQLGLIPVVQSLECLSCSSPMTGDAEIKYKAVVEVIRLTDGVVLSRGFAVCSNKEYSKKKFDEYAIASMAQTRAVGKAYRNILSWLMKAAGFEATPAEEMDFAKNADLSDVPDEGERKLLRDLVYSSDLNDEERETAFTAIEFCNDYKRYQQIQHKLEVRQKPYDQITNPSATDAKKQVKKVAGNGVSNS